MFPEWILLTRMQPSAHVFQILLHYSTVRVVRIAFLEQSRHGEESIQCYVNPLQCH